ncbi:MAG: hypothetical protein Kow009_05490 [Spirochaetales bacterium]
MKKEVYPESWEPKKVSIPGDESRIVFQCQGRHVGVAHQVARSTGKEEEM